MDIAFKNLWLNLTIVLPGVATYGIWRLVILITGFDDINFEAIDNSAILSLSVLFAVALLQQSVGIAIEACLAGFFAIFKRRWPNAYRLFVGRFAALVHDDLPQPVLRTVGQFFLSLNLLVGESLILLFVIVTSASSDQRALCEPEWLGYVLCLMIAVSGIVGVFRAWNAIVVLREYEQKAVAQQQHAADGGRER